MGPWQLTIISGDWSLVGEVFPLAPGRDVHVGRWVLGPPFSEISLQDKHVSRNHFRLRVTAKGVWLRELKTESGTYLNCRRIPPDTEQAVLPGDVIRVGVTILRLGPGLAVDPGWLRWNGGAVTRLARRIDEEQVDQLLPVLADMLEEAGCCDAWLLGHLRGPRPHVRGCFAVDSLLNQA
jgi:hypothetical protein